ncbi:hypothetical protein ONR57_06095 [Hoyosella sp. YIM 151337]|uniref:hypothetical protein n=1 Tax=Hoyosella sp. YIM 151337 TaxID=2992742 RepID=UPI0022367576|nr:hypothetical protein [Hoyosella sp. YIM 151337]MCW4352864.1 hypothetical protein [Hoyosella sp. YIM 151337]
MTNSEGVPAHEERQREAMSQGDETGEGAPDTSASRGRTKVLALTAAALAVISVVLGFLYWDAARGERALAHTENLRLQAVRDASMYSELMGTYDHENLDQSFSDVVEVSTPEFAAEYESVANELRDAVRESQGVSRGSAIHAAAQSVDDNQATVLVFLNQEVTNVLRPDGAREASRLVVTLQRDGDRWLLADVQPM